MVSYNVPYTVKITSIFFTFHEGVIYFVFGNCIVVSNVCIIILLISSLSFSS
jgi:hypothetical protein